MVELTTYDKFLLRGMVRQRLALYRDLQRTIENLAIEAGPETKALSDSSSAITAIRDQESDFEALLQKLG